MTINSRNGDGKTARTFTSGDDFDLNQQPTLEQLMRLPVDKIVNGCLKSWRYQDELIDERTYVIQPAGLRMAPLPDRASDQKKRYEGAKHAHYVFWSFISPGALVVKIHKAGLTIRPSIVVLQRPDTIQHIQVERICLIVLNSMQRWQSELKKLYKTRQRIQRGAQEALAMADLLSDEEVELTFESHMNELTIESEEEEDELELASIRAAVEKALDADDFLSSRTPILKS